MSHTIRAEQWWTKYGSPQHRGQRSQPRSRSVEPAMMLGKAARRDAELDEEISELMSLMEAELAAKRRLRSEIAEYQEILRQHAADKSRTQRQRSGAMNFDSLSYNRARGPSPSKLTGLFPHIENPSSYDLGLL